MFMWRIITANVIFLLLEILLEHLGSKNYQFLALLSAILFIALMTWWDLKEIKALLKKEEL